MYVIVSLSLHEKTGHPGHKNKSLLFFYQCLTSSDFQYSTLLNLTKCKDTCLEALFEVSY